VTLLTWDASVAGTNGDWILLVIPPKRESRVPADVANRIREEAISRGIPELTRKEINPWSKGGSVFVATRLGKPELTPYWKEYKAA